MEQPLLSNSNILTGHKDTDEGRGGVRSRSLPPVFEGILQGGVLWPLPFSFYVNDSS